MNKYTYVIKVTDSESGETYEVRYVCKSHTLEEANGSMEKKLRSMRQVFHLNNAEANSCRLEQIEEV